LNKNQLSGFQSPLNRLQFQITLKTNMSLKNILHKNYWGQSRCWDFQAKIYWSFIYEL